jgi:hypothetical protein
MGGPIECYVSGGEGVKYLLCQHVAPLLCSFFKYIKDN